jgi:hypothetical protein
MQSIVVGRSFRHALRRMDGRRPIRRARIVAALVAHSLNLAQGVGDAIAAYLACRSSICPSDHMFHPFVDIPHGSRSPIHNTDGQPLAYVYSRGSEAEARRAKMLTKDEARRIAVKVTRLPEPLGKAAGGPRDASAPWSLRTMGKGLRFGSSEPRCARSQLKIVMLVRKYE